MRMRARKRAPRGIARHVVRINPFEIGIVVVRAADGQSSIYEKL